MKLGCLSLNIRSVNNMIARRISDAGAYSSIPSSALGAGWILEYIYVNSGENIYQKNIERNFFFTRSAASKVLIQLESDNLIERHRVSHDARLKKLVLTEKGREIAEAVHEESRRVEASLLAGLTSEEARCFLHALAKLRLPE